MLSSYNYYSLFLNIYEPLAKVVINNKNQLLCPNNRSLEMKKETYKKLYV